MKPSLSKMFLQKIQECFNGREEFAEHVDKCVFMHECVGMTTLKMDQNLV